MAATPSLVGPPRPTDAELMQPYLDLILRLCEEVARATGMEVVPRAVFAGLLACRGSVAEATAFLSQQPECLAHRPLSPAQVKAAFDD